MPIIKRWGAIVAIVAGIALLLMILAPRLWVKNSRAHLTVDGRVSDDFKLYFGPRGKLLLRIGAKEPRQTFIYSGGREPGWDGECDPSEFLFPPFVAISQHSPPRCEIGEPYAALADGNKLAITARDGHRYEVTWLDPPR